MNKQERTATIKWLKSFDKFRISCNHTIKCQIDKIIEDLNHLRKSIESDENMKKLFDTRLSSKRLTRAQILSLTKDEVVQVVIVQKDKPDEIINELSFEQIVLDYLVIKDDGTLIEGNNNEFYLIKVENK